MHQIDWRFVNAGIAIMVFGLIVACWLGYHLTVGSKWAARRVLRDARTLAVCRWYVKETVRFSDGVGLGLYPEGKERLKVFIPFRSGHPSVDVIQGLEHLDIVEFRVQEVPLECALKTEICAYLSIEKVGHFS